MKKTLIGLVLAVSGAGWASDGAAVRSCTMERLPPGNVSPQGWLRKQMEMQRDGLTGHAEELYEDIGKSDWITRGTRGGQFAWERGPYYAKGLLSLAFALDDAELKARAKKWVDAYNASQRENGDFGPKNRNWWANMIVLWTLRDWCEATGDPRVVPFLERYFAFQRAAFESGDSLSKDSRWAIARGGDEIDVLVWLCRRTGKQEWADLARRVAGMSADWTSFYHKGGASDPGYRVHIVNYMQGLKLPALKWLLGGGEEDRTAVRAALDPSGWAMKKCGRPDRAVNGSEPLTSRSSTEGIELCATAEHILSAQVALEALGDTQFADDLEMAAYNTLPATIGGDGRGLRYYCLLNQPACIDAELKFACNGRGMLSTVAGPYAGYGCCRSNFHFAWPKVAESMWMKREGGLAAVVYGDCTVKTLLATVRETGGYPFSDGVRLEIVETAGGEWPLFVRIPGWCKAASTMSMRRLIAGAAVAASAMLPMSASAATAVWAGDVAGSVDDETKWVNGYKPQAGDTLDFSAVTATGMTNLSDYRAINGPSSETHYTTLTGLDHVYLGGTTGGDVAYWNVDYLEYDNGHRFVVGSLAQLNVVGKITVKGSNRVIFNQGSRWIDADELELKNSLATMRANCA